MCRVIRKVKFEVKIKVKRSLALNVQTADSGNFLTEMGSLGNFLQNDSKFVEISQVVAKIPHLKFWRVPPFFAQTPIFEGAYLQNYSPNFNKLKILGFFT